LRNPRYSREVSVRELRTKPAEGNQFQATHTVFATVQNGYGRHLTSMQKLDVVNREIIIELHRAINALGADPELLATVGSWGDKLEDEKVLEKLKAWNATKGKLISTISGGA